MNDPVTARLTVPLGTGATIHLHFDTGTGTGLAYARDDTDDRHISAFDGMAGALMNTWFMDEVGDGSYAVAPGWTVAGWRESFQPRLVEVAQEVIAYGVAA